MDLTQRVFPGMMEHILVRHKLADRLLENFVSFHKTVISSSSSCTSVVSS